MGNAPPTDRASWGQTMGAGVALLVAVALCAISATLNYKFGQSLGRTEADGQIYGAAAICADVLKALAPFMIVAAWRARMWSHMAAGLAVWTVTTAFALTGALGHVSLNRTEVSAHREVASTNYADLRDEQRRLKQAIAWIPQHRAAASIEADIKGQEINRLWTVTRSCTDATAPASREFCTGYQKLVAELGSAKEAAALQARLDRTTDKLQALGGAAEADPQAKALSKLSSLDVALVQTLLMLLFVGLLEIGSGLAPYAAVAMMRAPVSKAATSKKAEVSISATPATAVETPPATPAKTPRARDDHDDDAGNGPPAGQPTTVVQFTPKASPSVPSVATAMVEAETVAPPAPPSGPVRKPQALPDFRAFVAHVGTIPLGVDLARRWGVHKGTVSKWLRSPDFAKEVQRLKGSEASHPIAA